MQKNGFFLKTYFITYIAQSERDEYERKYKEAETNLATLNATLKVVNKERDEIARDLSQYKQEILLLKQDKDYLYKQYIDVQNKYTLNESKIENLHVQLEDMKKSREEIYEKYINSK
jgi:progesterone-induced-blocking factor 1